MPSLQQTLDQHRAAQAWQDVSVATQKKYKNKYGPLAKKLPMYILTNGLGQTLAFLRAKGKGTGDANEHQLLYSQLSVWVTQEMNWKRSDLLDKLTDSQTSSATYRRATAEALAYLNWLKRFAEAEPELGADETGD